MYVCSGNANAVAGAAGSVIPNKSFTRTISVVQMPTYEGGQPNTQYNDDLRLSSQVTFKGINGLSHTVTITRYMHALP
jgi:hypothetical protein